MNELIWLGLGFIFGVVFTLNHKDWRQQKTYEQLDEDLRKELALNKNLVESLKKDLSWAKQRNAILKEKSNGNPT